MKQGQIAPLLAAALCCWCWVPCAEGRALTLSPDNAAVVAGEPTTLRCLSNTSTLTWARSDTANPPYTRLASNCILDPQYADIYYLEGDAPGHCDLVVMNATRNEASMYICAQTVGFDPAVSSYLAVVDAVPDCRVDNTAPRVDENVTLTCDVSYTPNVAHMLMAWTDGEGRPVASYIDVDRAAGFTTSSVSVVAPPGTLPQFTCTTYFSDPVDLPSTATNTPELSFNWTSPPLTVRAPLETPLNTADVQDQGVSLACRRASQNVVWNFAPVNSTSSVAIASHCAVLPAEHHRYRIDSALEACHLVIDRLDSAHAGTYTCQDLTSTELPASAQLIVLKSPPECSNETEDDLPLNEYRLSCSVVYSGNLAPGVAWTDEGTGAALPSTTDTGRTIVRSRATVSAAELPRVISAMTYFSEPRLEPPGHLDPATNAPNYTHLWITTLPLARAPLETPLNTADVQDQGVSLACSRASQNVVWNFTPVNATSSVTIASRCAVLPAARHRYRIDSALEACHLVIDRLDSAHAGTYTCQDLTSMELPASAQLVVLESPPECSNETEDDLPLNEYRLSCSVVYSGNLAPEVAWTDEGTGAALPSTTDTGRTIVRSRATVSAAELPRVISAMIYFSEPRLEPPGHIDPATNAPNYTHLWVTTLPPAVVQPSTELPTTELLTTEQQKTELPTFARQTSEEETTLDAATERPLNTTGGIISTGPAATAAASDPTAEQSKTSDWESSAETGQTTEEPNTSDWESSGKTVPATVEPNTPDWESSGDTVSTIKEPNTSDWKSTGETEPTTEEPNTPDWESSGETEPTKEEPNTPDWESSGETVPTTEEPNTAGWESSRETVPTTGEPNTPDWESSGETVTITEEPNTPDWKSSGETRRTTEGPYTSDWESSGETLTSTEEPNTTDLESSGETVPTTEEPNTPDWESSGETVPTPEDPNTPDWESSGETVPVSEEPNTPDSESSGETLPTTEAKNTPDWESSGETVTITEEPNTPDWESSRETLRTTEETNTPDWESSGETLTSTEEPNTMDWESSGETVPTTEKLNTQDWESSGETLPPTEEPYTPDWESSGDALPSTEEPYTPSWESSGETIPTTEELNTPDWESSGEVESALNRSWNIHPVIEDMPAETFKHQLV